MHKGQVTVFVIIGIVILVLFAFVLIIVNSQKSPFSLKQDSQPERLEYGIKTCIDSTITSTTAHALETGIVSDRNQLRTISIENKKYFLAYDQEYPEEIGFAYEDEFKNEVLTAIYQDVPSCIISLDADGYFDLNNETFEMENLDVEITNNNIKVVYAYEYKYNGARYPVESESNVKTSLFILTTLANEAILEYFESMQEYDPIFNKQVCIDQISRNLPGPEYAIDFMKLNSFKNVTLYRDFFLITITEGKDSLTFAIRPAKKEAAC